MSPVIVRVFTLDAKRSTLVRASVLTRTEINDLDRFFISVKTVRLQMMKNVCVCIYIYIFLDMSGQ